MVHNSTSHGFQDHTGCMRDRIGGTLEPPFRMRGRSIGRVSDNRCDLDNIVEMLFAAY